MSDNLLFYTDNIWIQVNNFVRIQSGSSNLMTLEEVAMGFIKVANESMCRPIRALTQVNFNVIMLLFNDFTIIITIT